MKPKRRGWMPEHVSNALLSRAQNVVDQIIEKLDEADLLGTTWEHFDDSAEMMSELRQAWIDIVFDELLDVRRTASLY